MQKFNAGCIRWYSYENQNSHNGRFLGSPNNTLTACQAYCIANQQCLAVDFNPSDGSCGAHLNADNLLPQNTFGRFGLTQYRIERICQSTPTTGVTLTKTTTLRPTTSTTGTTLSTVFTPTGTVTTPSYTTTTTVYSGAACCVDLTTDKVCLVLTSNTNMGGGSDKAKATKMK